MVVRNHVVEIQKKILIPELVIVPELVDTEVQERVGKSRQQEQGIKYGRLAAIILAYKQVYLPDIVQDEVPYSPEVVYFDFAENHISSVYENKGTINFSSFG